MSITNFLYNFQNLTYHSLQQIYQAICSLDDYLLPPLDSWICFVLLHLLHLGGQSSLHGGSLCSGAVQREGDRNKGTLIFISFLSNQILLILTFTLSDFLVICLLSYLTKYILFNLFQLWKSCVAAALAIGCSRCNFQVN